MNIKINNLIIALFFILSTTIYSQTIDPVKKITKYTHTIYGEKDGVKDVLDLIQDQTGYLWIASYSGLIRYDGLNFKLYNQSNREDLDITAVRALNIDKNENLWVGSNDNGLAILQNNKFTMYNTENGIPNNSIRQLFTDSKNRTWIGTAAGLAKFENSKISTYPSIQDIHNLQTLFITENFDGDIIIGTNKIDGLYIYQDRKMTHYTKINELQDQKIVYMIHNKYNREIWALSEKNLYKIKNNKVETIYNLKDVTNLILSPQKLYVDKNESLWIVADGGIIRLHNGLFSTYTSLNGLSDDLVKSIYHDIEGTLWVGTRMGLDKFVEPKFKVYSSEEGLVNNAVNAVLEDNNSNIWIGTNQGISIYDSSKEKIINNIQQDKLNTRIRHLFMDNDQNIWISTYGNGLAKYKNNQITKWYTAKDGLAGDKVRTVYQDSKNRIWVGTTTGLSIISDNGIDSYSTQRGMSFEYVMCFYETHNGNMWIGTDGGGILEYKNGIFSEVLTKDRGLAGNVIFRIYEDKSGAIWITTGTGISKYNEGKTVNYTIKDGLLNNSIFQLIEDGSNNMWLTSTEGVFTIDYNDLIEKKLNFKVYNLLNGLPGSPTSTAWGIVDSGNHLWIPTYSGVAVINPGNISINRVPPKIAIDNQIIIDNISKPRYNAQVLDPDTKRITFSFASLSFQIPENVYTQYKLVGFDDDWSPLSTKREANYTNLSPGKYSFHVRGYNNDGLISNNDATFNFIKQPQIYETWWFRSLAVILLLLVVIFIVFHINNLRLKRLQEKFNIQQKELELERKAKEAEQLARVKEEKLTKSYSRFVPHEFIDLLNKKSIQKVKLGDQIETNMTIFVSDIRNFTSISEKLTPEENINFLNTYLEKVVPLIRGNGGLIDKYMGDGVMALFPNQAEKALETAVRFQNVLRAFNKDRESLNKAPINAGISLHIGSLMLGILGEENRMDATVISDSVNLTFRLESLTKYYKCNIIVSENVKNSISKKYTTRFLSCVKVKGKSKPTKIYEVIEGCGTDEASEKIDSLSEYNIATKLLYSNKFKEALEKFNLLTEKYPNDELFKISIKLCKKMLNNNTGKKWDGIFRL